MLPGASVRTSSTRSAANLFHVLEDGQQLDEERLASARTANAAINALAELPIEHCQNKTPVARDPSTKALVSRIENLYYANSPDAPSIKPRLSPRIPRRRRPPVDQETFEPLDSVQEEASGFADSESSTVHGASPGATSCQQSLLGLPQTGHLKSHPLAAAEPGCPIRQQVANHLAATPLGGNACSLPELGLYTALIDQVDMALTQPPMGHEPLKVPDTVNVVEQAVSPAISATSDRSGFFLDASPAGSLSLQRIEDSLEEIDKLEEQLEAVDAVTGPRHRAEPERKNASNAPLTPLQGTKWSTASKRASIPGQFATVRVKPSAKARPALRRSASMTLRENEEAVAEIVPEQKAHASLSRNKSTLTRPKDIPKPPIKSTKPPTVPNFELPGEAVSRRLKEQREARQQRAEAQKAYVAPPKPKSNKPLTKPTFELPGEAISRRKREERELKLKAQEQEERKRREFKARPIRHSIAPSTLPRETITSRARQTKASQEEIAAQQAEISRSRRSIAGSSRAPISTSTASSSTIGRGRDSMATSLDDISRATSESVGSTSGKRSSVSTDEAAQRLRGRDILQRDNSFSQDRERERRDRELNAKMAREEAAERSRAASREWAEKKRRRELAQKAAMREAIQASDQQASTR